MVKGESYYAKFQTTPSVTLTGYSGVYQITDKDHNVDISGAMTKGIDYFEATFSTATLEVGVYRVVCLVTFPDGFIQAINDEQIQVG